MLVGAGGVAPPHLGNTLVTPPPLAGSPLPDECAHEPPARSRRRILELSRLELPCIGGVVRTVQLTWGTAAPTTDPVASRFRDPAVNGGRSRPPVPRRTGPRASATTLKAARILIDTVTANRVRDYVELRRVGAVSLKNLSSPVEIWEVGMQAAVAARARGREFEKVWAA